MTAVSTVPRGTRPQRPPPPHALTISLLALAVPIAATTLASDWVETDGALLVWLPPLLPAFLLAYYRGWTGASLALAGGMATLALTQAEILLLELHTPPWPFLLGVVVLLVVVSMGAGASAELLHRERDAAERAALTDSLTGLPNRRHASVFLEAAWAAAARGRPLTVVLFDIDHFKLVNDLHGHAAGDRVLQELANVLRLRTRRMDLSARFGGEEFISVLPDCSMADGAAYAEVVCTAVSSVDFGWGHVTVSAGVSAAVSGMGSPDVLVATADRALYEAKKRGRNLVVRADLVRWSIEAIPSPERTPTRAGATSLEGLRVILVDDDDVTLRSATRLLQRYGCSVRATTSARQALALLVGPDPVDVLVTDIVMPEMSGFTLVDQVSRVRPGLAVLYVSGYPKAEVYWGGTPGVRSAFLGKPLDAEDLRDTLLSLVSSGGREATSRPVTRHAEEHEGTHVSPGRPAGGGKAVSAPGLQGRILIVDDDEQVVRSLQRLFTRAGYAEPLGLSDPRRVAGTLADETVDLMILDLSMPNMNGFEVLARIKGLVGPETYLPVLMMTGSDDPDTRRRALKAGAMDFLNKPFDPAEAEARVRNLLTTRFLYQRLARHRDVLEEEVSTRTAEIADARAEILYRLARAAEYRDDVTGRHAERVGLLSATLASELGLSPAETDLIYRAAPLHDLGKIGVPDAILLKPGPLTPAETAVMQSHTTIGAEILGGSLHRILEVARAIALSHHERWDGGGYPHGLVGVAIPLPARVVAVADTFDTITHTRSYKEARSAASAFGEIARCSGSQFDPAVVDALQAIVDRVGLERIHDLASPLDAAEDTQAR